MKGSEEVNKREIMKGVKKREEESRKKEQKERR